MISKLELPEGLGISPLLTIFHEYF
jgi:hypothetical protein